jgi:hypothetical protein
MSDRNRRILAWVVTLAGIVLFGYVALMGALVLRGDLEPGPLRLTTLALNGATAIALLFLGRLTFRSLPPRR